MDAGFLGKIAKKKPYLRLANKSKRLRWAKELGNWTAEDCKCFDKGILKFEMFGSQRLFMRCRTDEDMLEECLMPSVKHGEGGPEVKET